jgi:anti-sigma regulatory factor (Ser/Thr protein kinase)
LVWAVGDDERLTFANRAWREYTTLGVGSTFEERNAIVHPDDLPQLMRALRSGESDVELRIRRASDGAYRWHVLRWRRFHGEYGPQFVRVGTAIDVHADRLLYEREHRVADVLQSASLPKKLPRIPGLSMSAIYAPGRSEAQIGGDWYDAFRLVDGRVVISIGDVAGNGLDAAVTMGAVRQVIRGSAQIDADPVRMLDAADRALRLEDGNRFVTACVAVLDPVDESLHFASAGHPPALLRRANGSLEELSFVDLPLGLRGDQRSASESVRLHPGDLLAFYTDGLIESSHDVGGGLAALAHALNDSAISGDVHPAAALYERLLPEGPHDDVAILTVRIGDRSPALHRWRYARLDADASASLHARLRETLKPLMLESDLLAAEIVLGELIANAVRHAPGEVEFVLDVHDENAPVLHARDRGPGLQFSAALPADPLSESGRGLYIISELTRFFSVTRRSPHGTHARAVLKAE